MDEWNEIRKGMGLKPLRPLGFGSSPARMPEVAPHTAAVAKLMVVRRSERKTHRPGPFEVRKGRSQVREAPFPRLLGPGRPRRRVPGVSYGRF